MDMKEIMDLLYKNYTTKGMVCGDDTMIDCDKCPFESFNKCLSEVEAFKE